MSHFETATTYPLVDPERYDDEYGEGYAFARVAGDMMGLEMTIVDCWIVDAEGTRHPGIDSCPVPVRIQDVDVDRARPSEPRSYDADY